MSWPRFLRGCREWIGAVRSLSCGKRSHRVEVVDLGPGELCAEHLQLFGCFFETHFHGLFEESAGSLVVALATGYRGAGVDGFGGFATAVDISCRGHKIAALMRPR